MGWLKMYMVAMLAAMFVSVVVFGVVAIVLTFKNLEGTKRTQEKRVEEWQNIVANLEFPTQSQIWLQKVKEDEMRRNGSAGKKIEAEATAIIEEKAVAVA